MSGRQSGSQNTLFNYFTKTPCKTNGSAAEKDVNNTNGCKIKGKEKVEKRKFVIEDSDSDDDRLLIDSSTTVSRMSSSDEEKCSPPKKKIKVEDTIFTSKQEKESKHLKLTTPSKPTKSDLKTPKKPTKPLVLKAPTTPKTKTPSKTRVETKADTKVDQQNVDEFTWFHYKLEFLKPEKIRDKNCRKPSDPDYDARTLYVPPDFIVKQTPAMQQWWTLKREHYDCVLFFKVGKFYELYHMDAVIGVNELGFAYMKGEFAHSGFPEVGYGRMATTLVELGYKVARVEQTETPEQMNKRQFASQKKSKVVKREICQITNKGTRVQGLLDLDLSHALSTYLLAIYENKSNNSIEFGVCFVDTSIGIFYLGQFEDDERYSRLLTMLTQYPAAVILEERRQLSYATKNLLKQVTGITSFESLFADSQFMSSKNTLKKLQENGYFGNEEDVKVKLPSTLQNMIKEDDPLNVTCKLDYELAIRCLGACWWYLKDCLLDIQLFSLGKFAHYIPLDMETDTGSRCKFMILDTTAMSGLNILGKGETLEATLDHCMTAMGKRLLHQWVCKPFCNVEEIRDRQDAISELIRREDLLSEARCILKTLPDLERLISRIHCLGNGMRAKNHPDSRATLYEEKTYSKKKVKDFIVTLNGFENAMNLGEIFSGFESKLLTKYAGFNSEAMFPDIMDTIVYFKNSFNAVEAEKEGKIIPQKGVDREYDLTILEIEILKKELDEYLKKQQKYFGCHVTYFGNDKKRYQLDIPEHAVHKVDSSYSLEGTKNGSKPSSRFSTMTTKSLLARMIAAETKSTEILQDINRRIFEKFSKKYDEWSLACYCLAVIDVLCSFAHYTMCQNVTTCKPEVLPFSSSPTMIIKDGVHPFKLSIENFVPNDAELGTSGHANTLVLTGPNMGGKSTLMRQVGVLTIMAQLGCHVPASEMRLSVVDRIFSRLGAHDNIIKGNSTFLVELKEASAILKHSTKHSLLFLDEFGRGTTTYDGAAMATAYVHYLIKINCRTIFSTHYYSLLDFFKGNNNIQLGHMACKVESETEEDTKLNIIFMYKMLAGPCPKSYGFNAARLAGIPHCVTQQAREVAQKLEAETIARKLFRQLLCDHVNIRDILNALTH